MDEITLSASLGMKKNGVSESMQRLAEQFDMSGTDYFRGTQTIGTSEEALDIGDIGTCGYMLIVNLDEDNYVSIRPGSGTANLVKLDANGGMALFKLAMNTPHAIANTAACQVEYLLLEA